VARKNQWLMPRHVPFSPQLWPRVGLHRALRSSLYFPSSAKAVTTKLVDLVAKHQTSNPI
jgi:hypothetical protein